MINYQALKRLAKASKVSVKELLALAPQNDPFYINTKGDVEKAEWLAEIYEELGSPSQVHIRRIHYFLVSREDILKPNGEQYENTQNDWGYLVQASKFARYLGLVPIDNFVDRRNPDPHINASYHSHREIDDILASLDPEQVAEAIVNRIHPYNPQHALAYHLEIWAEKSTQNDIILPIAGNYKANVVTGLGELSITAVNQLIHRIQQADKPVRIFYISDFDPAGETMPISVARKIEYFAHNTNLKDIKLNPLMLTKEQCREYQLPRTPIKESDKRKPGFEERHGSGATELDALEALHPGEMGGIFRQAISLYVDVESYNAVIKENERIRLAIKEALQERLEEVLSDFSLDYDSDFDMPEVSLIRERDGWLFDSERSYVDQLGKYKSHKGR